MLGTVQISFDASNRVDERHGATPQSVLMATLEVLDRSGVRYAVLHGYERFPETTGSDVDICIDSSIDDRWIRSLLDEHAAVIGARVVDQHDGTFLLADLNDTGPMFFLKLDFEHDYALGGRCFVAGDELLAARKRFGAFQIPAPAHELAGYLASTLMKDRIEPPRTARLAALFRMDRVGGARELARLWPAPETALLLSALESEVWAPVIAAAPALRRRIVRRDRAGSWRSTVGRLLDQAQRAISPPGLSVVVLGPDGAGKSTVTDALAGPNLIPIFDRAVCWGFVPPMHRLIGRNHGASIEPHALAPRSGIGSLVKAVYWLVFSWLSHPRTYMLKARRGLVLYDRHFVDILVDPRRYRYRGPRWLLTLIWRLIPRPDLIVLLNAPAETIQKRKRELTVAETRRQLNTYSALVRSLDCGVVIDADRPLEDTIRAVQQAILARRGRAHT